VVDLGEEDESAQGIVDLGAEEMRTTARGRGARNMHMRILLRLIRCEVGFVRVDN
jgi:hypothetical protein